MDLQEKLLDRPARYARLSLSFPAMMCSVFLLPIFLKIVGGDLAEEELYSNYFPLAAGFVVFFVWLITVLVPLLRIPSTHWWYQKKNPILLGVLHAAAISIPLFLPFCLDDGEYHLIALALLGGLFTGTNFYLLLQWKELLENLKNSVALRSLLFLSPLGIAALYYLAFPRISPDAAYSLMLDPIQDRIYFEELSQLEVGESLANLHAKYPDQSLSRFVSSEDGLFYYYPIGNESIQLKLRNDTVVERELIRN